jgi:hypothetical protein
MMILVEVLQWWGVLKFKFYFIPYFVKPKKSNYSKAKKADTVLDVVFGVLGAGIGFGIVTFARYCIGVLL